MSATEKLSPKGLGKVIPLLFPLASLWPLSGELDLSATVTKPSSLWESLESPQRLIVHGGPRHILDRVGIAPGSRVLELGPGVGFFTIEAAHRVGPSGRLYCVEIDPLFVDRLERKVRVERLSNVEVVEGDAAAMPFQDESVDMALLIAFLGEMSEPVSILKELRRVLRPKGMLSISESLPNPDYPLRRTVKGWCREAGFIPVEQRGSFFCYTLNFRKAPDWWWM